MTGPGFADLESYGDAPALVLADGPSMSYRDLAAAADRLAERLDEHVPAGGGLPSIGLVLCTTSVHSIVAYVAARRHRRTVILADGSPAAPPHESLVDAFGVSWIARPDGSLDTTRHRRTDVDHPPIDDRAAVLLPTSGTTGSPKHVVLSARNLDSNAASIISYLGITADERPLGSLPLQYSYGLSVLNSHLLSGAALVLTSEPMTSRRFWDIARSAGVTSLAGVPSHYQVLLKLGLDRVWVPTFRTLTQAGGPLGADDVRRIARYADERGARFVVMYGQTEATARMGFLPPEDAVEHAGTIGRAIPGGRFHLVDGDGRAIASDGVEGELVYRGPNVMQGYAVDRSDLTELDPPAELATGDLAVREPSGYFRITGRLKRIVKVRGHRVGLDELERTLRTAGIETICGGADDAIVIGHLPDVDPAAVHAVLTDRCGLPAAAINLRALDAWPTTAVGKVDYHTLVGAS